MRENLKRFYVGLLVLILTVIGQYGHTLQSQTTFMAQTESKKQSVYASGVPVGIYVKTEGILVLGIQQVEEKDGKVSSPAVCKVKAGDYILKLNNTEISTKQQFIRMLQKNGEKEVILTIKRKNKKIKVKLHPVYSVKNHSYQIGVWIRNDTQGIGTVTFVKEDGTFAALGHGISDGDIGVQFLIEGGSAYRTTISSVLKGKAGSPGELIGTIQYIPENYLGDIYTNTNGGISGKITNHRKDFCIGQKMPVARKNEVETGEALLRSSVSGESRDYHIKIERIYSREKDSLKTLKIKVTDPELIALTGGIVQGLSGSPILQNGKLVGAVTHVLIDNPKMGYGIFAESMLE